MQATSPAPRALRGLPTIVDRQKDPLPLPPPHVSQIDLSLGHNLLSLTGAMMFSSVFTIVRVSCAPSSWAEPVPVIFARTGYLALYFGTGTCSGNSDTGTRIPAIEEQEIYLFLWTNVGGKLSLSRWKTQGKEILLKKFIEMKQFWLFAARNSRTCITIPCTFTCSKKCEISWLRENFW